MDVLESQPIIEPVVAQFLQRLLGGETIDLTLRTAKSGDPGETAVADAIDALLARFHDDYRTIVRLANTMSTKAASNSFLLDGIARATNEQFASIETLAGGLDETSHGARAVAGAAARTRSLTDQVRERSETSFSAVQRALDGINRLEASARDSAAAMAEVARASEVIGSLAEVIEDISQATNLLGINALIEAAHAGDAGRGFGVVANEIKRLADSTRSSARQIAETIAGVRRAVASAERAAGTNVEYAATVAEEADGVRASLAGMRDAIDDTSAQIASIATTVSQQSETLEHVSEMTRQLLHGAKDVADGARDAAALHLDELNRAMFGIIGGYELGTYIDTIRGLALQAAADVETIIETAIQRGTLRAADIFDTDYRQVNAAGARIFAHLFDVARLGPQGFVPAKYTTKWDRTLDEQLRELVDDRRWALAGIRYLCVVDINGYLTMHAAQFRQAITGDAARDLSGNRVKRVFDDPVGLRCGRVGLDGADGVPKRASRAQFHGLGVNLRQPAGRRPTLLQSYARDTGEVLNDLSAPVYVCGEHWGGVRIAFAADAVDGNDSKDR